MASTIAAFTPDRQEVYRYDGTPGTWTRIRQVSANELYGGGFGLFALQSDGLYWWRRRRYNYAFDAWHPIGGPGADFAVTGESVYGLTPDRSAVYRYNGSGSDWTRVGGPAKEIYGGGYGLVAISPMNGNVFRHLGGVDSWSLIGGAGAAFAVTKDTVFGLTPDKGAVYRYDGVGTSWTRVGGAANAMYAFEEQD
jgi:hypothetical protein